MFHVVIKKKIINCRCYYPTLSIEQTHDGWHGWDMGGMLMEVSHPPLFRTRNREPLSDYTKTANPDMIAMLFFFFYKTESISSYLVFTRVFLSFSLNTVVSLCVLLNAVLHVNILCILKLAHCKLN